MEGSIPVVSQPASSQSVICMALHSLDRIRYDVVDRRVYIYVCICTGMVHIYTPAACSEGLLCKNRMPQKYLPPTQVQKHVTFSYVRMRCTVRTYLHLQITYIYTPKEILDNLLEAV